MGRDHGASDGKAFTTKDTKDHEGMPMFAWAIVGLELWEIANLCSRGIVYGIQRVRLRRSFAMFVK
jgi:hypothetical protein